MRKNVLYVSPECFADTDMPVIKALCKIYTLHWIIVFESDKIGGYRSSKNEIASFADENNISYTVLTRTRRRRDPLNMFFDIKLISKIRKTRSDLVYIATLSDIYFSFLSIFISKKRSILAIHDVIDHVTAKWSFSEFFFRLANFVERSNFYNIHLFSDSQAGIFKKDYLNKRVFVVPFFLKKINSRRTGAISKAGKFNFLFWGTIRYNKGIDFLIGAAEKLFDSGIRNFKVTIAGKTDDWEKYNALIRHPEIFDLYISDDFIPIEQIPRFFLSADLFVLPYRDITQSGPLLYAYNYGLPAIASNLAGFKEYIIDGENGFLFESENVDSLYKVMKQALTLNEGSLLSVRNNLAEFVKNNISDDIILKKYMLMFNTVMAA